MTTPVPGRKPRSLPPLDLKGSGGNRPIPQLITDGLHRIASPMPPPSPGLVPEMMDTPRSLTPTSPCPAIKVQQPVDMDTGNTELGDDAHFLSPRLRCHSDASHFVKYARLPEKQRLEQDAMTLSRPLSMERLDLLRMEHGTSLSPPMSPREKNLDLRSGITPRGRPIRLEPLAPRPSTPDMHRDPRPDGQDLHSPDLHTPDLHTPDLHTPDLQTPDLSQPSTPEPDTEDTTLDTSENQI